MIKSFISLVAKDILQFTGGDMKDVAVVFPNRRAGSVFRNELVACMQTPSWSPGIFSIDDWLVGLSGLKKTEKLEELALLFPIVKKHLAHVESFADFIDLGETFLSDFEDTDKYLADPEKLFTTLREVKKIDSLFDITADEDFVERIRVFWSSFAAGHSSHQEKWLRIWECLYPVYVDFQASLLAKGLGTSGMCYRKAADDLISGNAGIGRFRKIVFAGFNILTHAEEAVFGHLRDAGTGVFYWDYHPWYLKEPNEAGKFIRQYLKSFPPPERFDPFPDGAAEFFHADSQDEAVTVVPVTSNTGQVQSLLNDLKSRPAVNRGIILSDEGLFSDLLSAWPEQDLPVNFTSGYPLSDTLAAGLYRKLSDVYLDISQSPGNSCSTELVEAFLRHPWAKWLAGDSVDKLVLTIQRRFPDVVPVVWLENESNVSGWLGNLNDTSDFLIRVSAVASRIQEFRSACSPIEIAAIDTIVRQASMITEMVQRYQLPLDPRSLSKIWLQFLNSTKLTLDTDRNATNQVTGVLETRLMDFDEVYILSFNEGVWPSKSLPGSLIPYSLRKLFHLPTAENRDAMYAYYFYRLIQRTGKLCIYYLTGHRDDGIRSGEKSRYITQLQFEADRPLVVRPEPPARIGAVAKPIIIPKDGIVYDRLTRFLAGSPENKSLSPSALNEYLDCSLRFALKRIYQMREPDEIAYASDPRGFGILIHQVMNRLYKNFLGSGNGPDADWFEKTLSQQKRIEEIIREEYNLVLKESAELNPGGKEILGMEVVKQFVMSILNFDRGETPFKILALEQDYRMEFLINVGGRDVAVNLNGIIDRIDQTVKGIRIVDYKTGNCALDFKTVADLFRRDSAKRPKEAFQVMLYCEFFMNKSGDTVDLLPSLFRPGRFQAGESECQVAIGGEPAVYSRFRPDFTAGMKTILEELFNPEIPFVQCEDEQQCRYCPFTGICSRES